MIETTISGIIVFSGVITILVVILNYAQSKLLPQDEVSLIINDKEDEAINVSPGSTLLSALSGEKIFLPSACGGGGTCALCKCQVLDGGLSKTGILARSTEKHNDYRANISFLAEKLCWISPVPSKLDPILGI